MKKSIEAAALAALTMCSCQGGTQVESPKNVLVVVDVQRDFFDASGSLYVG